ncbi:MAG TPA: cobalamin-dependent protein [Anaerolineaceae bacterium]|jgi:methylmalonyl-CoA mutase cobalamin-binding domain/chain
MDEQEKMRMQAEIGGAIKAGDRVNGVDLSRAALGDGITPLELLEVVIKPVMKDLGDEFARLDIFLPELMNAGAVVKLIQSQVLEPAIRTSGTQMENRGVVVIGTCQGDIHDIGKSMVALMLQVNGFKVIDLGTNVTPKAFLETARREQADIIAMSSLLTPSLPYMKDVIKRLVGLGERDQYLVIAGGASVSHEFAKVAGLDGYGEDAVTAVALCLDLMKRRKEAHS